jgi:hypothetical protein
MKEITRRQSGEGEEISLKDGREYKILCNNEVKRRNTS